MKKAYLVHVFRKGAYNRTVSYVFTSRKAAEKYANNCGEIHCEVEQVDCISLNDY